MSERAGAPIPVGKPTLTLTESGVIKFSFVPATPDAAISYVFILGNQDGNVQESALVGFASLAAGTGGSLEYTWASAPSGQFTGKVR